MPGRAREDAVRLRWASAPHVVFDCKPPAPSRAGILSPDKDFSLPGISCPVCLPAACPRRPSPPPPRRQAPASDAGMRRPCGVRAGMDGGPRRCRRSRPSLLSPVGSPPRSHRFEVLPKPHQTVALALCSFPLTLIARIFLQSWKPFAGPPCPAGTAGAGPGAARLGKGRGWTSGSRAAHPPAKLLALTLF